MASPATHQQLDRPGQAFFFVLAAALVGQALAISNGHQDPDAMRLVSAALGLSVLGVLLPTIRALTRFDQPATLGLLGLATTWQFATLFRSAPGVYLHAQTPWATFWFVFGLAAAAVLAGAGLSEKPALGRARMPLLLLVHFLLGCWLINASPSPIIDVDLIQRESVKALMEGKNPYALTFPNLYGNMMFFGSKVATADRINVGFSYPPLSLLLAMPGQLLAGDYRYSQLAAMVGAGALMAYARPGRLGPAIATFFLFTPRVFFVLEQGWTDPFLVLLVSAIVFLALRRPGVVPYLFGAFLVVKQYAAVAMAFSWLLLQPFSWRAFGKNALKAAAVGTVITLPFLLWDPGAFLWSVVTVNGAMPFRADALSFPAWLGGDHEHRWSLMSVSALGGSVVIASWRSARTPAGFATALVLLYFGFFSFGGHAFCNHYYFILGLMCIAAAACRLTPDAAPPPDDDPVFDWLLRRLRPSRASTP